MTKQKTKKNKSLKSSFRLPTPLAFIVQHNDVFYPLLLLLVAIACYGLMVRQLGFYWDEWAFVWIQQKLGDAGLERYFATNRPFWGLIYRLSMPLIGVEPWRWQIFSLFWRWLCAVALWGTLRLTWRSHKEVAATAGLLFLVYPGFDQQPIALMFGHFFVVMAAFLGSLALMQFAQQKRGLPAVGLTLAALLTSLLNLLAMEYFLVLDLIRVVLLWVIKGEDEKINLRQRLKQVFLAWLPYLGLFTGVMLWRTLFFKYQTQNYRPVLFNSLSSDPFGTLLTLIGTVINDLLTVVLAAWSKALQPANLEILGKSGLLGLALVAGFAALLTVSWFYWVRPSDSLNRRVSFEMLAVALIAMLLAGVPFWLTNLQVWIDYPLSRFTLPFTLGACLLTALAIWKLPGKHGLHVAFLAVVVACSAALQYQIQNDYRRDWALQKNFFWQLSWRAPAIKPGTALVINNFPMQHVSDNSLSGTLNDIYAPDNHSQKMDYMLYFASIRGDKYFGGFLPGQEISHDYLAATFYGSSDQTLALNFTPPSCLAVLDPLIDPANALLPAELRSAAALSKPQNILATPLNAPSKAIFGSEPAHGWCYYYEQAALAAQQKNWQQVVNLGDAALALDDYPNGPLERLPFIEGYAHREHWDQAVELSRITAGISPVTHAPLCKLWARINTETPLSDPKTSALKNLNEFLNCES
ncbi:MAG: hypothetical protein LWX83_09685 [Anaerolineae bacterium]|nr:hypothetical protein [Anaerolineae bacterium]